MVAELISKKAAMRKAIREENEACAKELAYDLRECLYRLAQNESMFNLEAEDALIEAYIYERQALFCRYRHLQEKARALGLRVKGVGEWHAR